MMPLNCSQQEALFVRFLPPPRYQQYYYYHYHHDHYYYWLWKCLRKLVTVSLEILKQNHYINLIMDVLRFSILLIKNIFSLFLIKMLVILACAKHATTMGI